jgi:TonB family protein
LNESSEVIVNKTKAINLPILASGALLTLGACLIAVTARAELRCDCAQIIETCSASVSFDENKINIESNSNACSRIDYLIDGQPFAALVVDGEADFDWRGQPQTAPQIVVENCRVCADNSIGNAKATKDQQPTTEYQGPTAEADVRPVVKVMPTYPRAAWGAGIEGRVSVEFDVSAEGIVQNIKVIDSSNQVFINAAIDAMSRFRYTPKAAKGLKEEFYFKLVGGSEPTVTSNTL